MNKKGGYMMKIGNMNYGISAYSGIGQNYNCRAEYFTDKSKFAIKEADTHIKKYFGTEEVKESEGEKVEAEGSTTDTDILVKPDGSRVLIMTTNIGGMTTSMSLKISEPTRIPNESSDANATEEENQNVRSRNKGTSNLTAGPERGSTHVGGV